MQCASWLHEVVKVVKQFSRGVQAVFILATWGCQAYQARCTMLVHLGYMGCLTWKLLWDMMCCIFWAIIKLYKATYRPHIHCWKPLGYMQIQASFQLVHRGLHCCGTHTHIRTHTHTHTHTHTQDTHTEPVHTHRAGYTLQTVDSVSDHETEHSCTWL